MDDRTSRALKYYARHPLSIVEQIQRFRKSQPQYGRFSFVLGPPRSGTTLVHRLLLNHSLINGFSYETSIISPKPVADFQRFKHYVSTEVHEEALKSTEDIPHFFARLHSLALPKVQKPHGWFVEKTPQHAKRLSYILKNFPNAKVVFCVRDARDTFCSGRAAGNIPQARSVKKHAAYFKKCMNPYFENLSSDRIRLMRYEDLAANPMESLARLMEFLDLELEPAQLETRNTAADARSSHKAFDRLSKPINSSTVGRWRDEMSEAEIRQYTKISGSALSRLGYEIEV